jgi:uncharacterized protein (DUF362 family)
MSLSRRNFLYLGGAAAGAYAAGQRLFGQQAAQQYPPAVATPPIFPNEKRATVSLVHGDQRRKNVTESLMLIDDRIKPLLARKKYVVIKPNIVNTSIHLAATHPDALLGIVDYLAPRFKGEVVIAESSAYDTLEGYENHQYKLVAQEYKQVRLVDLNREGKYEVAAIIDSNVRPTAVRLAARLFDPDAFVISSAMLKTHNYAVATLSIKNMVLGAPLRDVAATPAWHDKRLMHAGPKGNSSAPHQMHYNMAIVAAKMKPNFGVALVDGFEGMEGNGPSNGTPVPSHIALASTDYFAVDRVGIETMGIPGHAVGYLNYGGQLGLGQIDMAKIDIRGVKPETVKRTYMLHERIQEELKWLGDLPMA